MRPLSWPVFCSLPLDVDNGYYTVKFDSLLLKEAVVEGDSILPPLRTDPTGSSDSDSGDPDDPSYARGMAAVQDPRSQESGARGSVGSSHPERLPAGRACDPLTTSLESMGAVRQTVFRRGTCD